MKINRKKRIAYGSTRYKALMSLLMVSLFISCLSIQDNYNYVRAADGEATSRFANVNINAGAKLYFNNIPTTYVGSKTVLSDESANGLYAGTEEGVKSGINNFSEHLSGDKASQSSILKLPSLPTVADVKSWSSIKNLQNIGEYWLDDVKSDANNIIRDDAGRGVRIPQRAYAKSDNSINDEDALTLSGKTKIDSSIDGNHGEQYAMFDDKTIKVGSYKNINAMSFEDWVKKAGFYRDVVATGEFAYGRTMFMDMTWTGQSNKLGWIGIQNIGDTGMGGIPVYGSPECKEGSEIPIKVQPSIFNEEPVAAVEYKPESDTYIVLDPGNIIKKDAIIAYFHTDYKWTNNKNNRWTGSWFVNGSDKANLLKFKGTMFIPNGTNDAYAPEFPGYNGDRLSRNRDYYVLYAKAPADMKVAEQEMATSITDSFVYFPTETVYRGKSLGATELKVRPKMTLDTSSIKFARAHTSSTSIANNPNLGTMPTTSLAGDDSYKLVLNSNALGVNGLVKGTTDGVAAKGSAKASAKVTADNTITVTPGTTEITIPVSTLGGNKVSAVSTKVDGTTATYGIVGDVSSGKSSVTINIAHLMNVGEGQTKVITLYNEELNGAGMSDGISTTGLDITIKVPENDYSISYDLNAPKETAEKESDITNPNKDRNSYKISTPDIRIAAPTLKGYTFEGWTEEVKVGGTGADKDDVLTGKGGTRNPDGTYTIKKGLVGDRKYTANWTRNNYTITIDPSGGKYNGDTNQVIINDVPYKDIRTIDDPTPPPGKKFIRWTITTGDGSSFGKGEDANKLTMGYEDAVLIANYDDETYTLTLNPNGGVGGTTETRDLNMGDTHILPDGSNVGTKTGYKFAGWSTSSSATGVDYAVGFKYSMPAANTILYAKWDENCKKVRYESNGGVGGMDDSVYQVDFDFSFEESKFTKTGYKFVGWKLANESGDELGGDEIYKAGANYVMPDYDIVATAQWEVIEYKITFDGKDVNELNTTLPATEERIKYPSGLKGKYTVEDTIVFDGKPTQVGKTFIGWTWERQSEAEISVNIPEGTTGILNFQSKWKVSVYPVLFHNTNADGFLEGMTQAVRYGNKAIEPTEGETPDSPHTDQISGKYTFRGWFADDKAGPDEEPFDFEGTPIKRPINLYALFDMNKYNVTFMSGATEQIGEMVSVAWGGLANPPTEFSKEYYTFTGNWYTDVECKNKFEMDTLIKKDTILYAGWEKTKYEVTYNGNGATEGDMPKTEFVVGDEKKLDKNTYKRTKFIFLGWNTSADGSGTAYADEGAIPTAAPANMTLYAQWLQEASYFLVIPTTIQLIDGKPGSADESKALKTEKIEVVIPSDCDKSKLPDDDIIIKTDITFPLTLTSSTSKFNVSVYKTTYKDEVDGKKVQIDIEYTDPSLPLVTLNTKDDSRKVAHFTLKTPRSDLKSKGVYTGTMKFKISYAPKTKNTESE